MGRTRTALSMIAMAFFALPLTAQESPVQLLVPVFAHNVPGAFGSLWDSELLVYNDGDSVVSLLGPCRISSSGAGRVGPTTLPCPSYDIVPGRETKIEHDFPDDTNAFWFASTPNPGDLSHLMFELRVFDKSRSESNWGTDVPVVNWTDRSGTDFWFLGVPATELFRHSVRVYFANGIPIQNEALVSYFDADSGQAITQRPLFFSKDPEMIQIDSLTVPELAGHVRVTIEVSVLHGPAPIWALVSVANQQTQALTILPGRRW